jgi:hypothetical protein
MFKRCLLLVALLVLSCSGGRLVISSSSGPLILDRAETRHYQEVEAYLSQRLKEVESIKVGTTYRNLRKFFTEDGGISSPPPHRFINILCPFVKINVSFDGEDRNHSLWPIPDEARVSVVTGPYFEQPYFD